MVDTNWTLKELTNFLKIQLNIDPKDSIRFKSLLSG
jgi:hypothetical protein